MGYGATITLVVILLLVGFLLVKETMSSVPDNRAHAVGRLLNVGAVPLLIAFAAIVLMKLTSLLLGSTP
jgi:hypothetical protein